MRFLFIMEHEADVDALCKVTIKESIVILQYSAKFNKFLSYLPLSKSFTREYKLLFLGKTLFYRSHGKRTMH
jgi:hypothetical protein